MLFSEKKKIHTLKWHQNALFVWVSGGHERFHHVATLRSFMPVSVWIRIRVMVWLGLGKNTFFGHHKHGLRSPEVFLKISSG